MKEIRNIDEFISEQKKIEKRKKNRRGKKAFKSFHVKNPENLLKKKKEINKPGYEETFFQAFQPLAKSLVKMFNGKNGNMDFEDVVDAFSRKKVAKAFLNVCEDYIDNGVKIPEVYTFLISELYLSGGDIKETKEFKKLLQFFKDYNEEKIEALEKHLKKLDVPKKERKSSALLFALLSASFPGYNRQRQRISKFFKQLYRSFNSGEDIKEKNIKGIIYTCFGKKSMSRISKILLKDKRFVAENLKTKEEKEVYSIVTTIILDFINKLDDDDRKELLKKYAKDREGKLNQKLRVNFYALSDDDYKKILKTISRLNNNGFRRELFE